MTQFASRLVLLIVVSLASCFGVRAQDRAVAPGESSGISVELMEPGEAPRRELRFRPTPGTKESVVMTMKMQQQMTMDGVQLPAPGMPVQRFIIDFSIADVTPDGDIQMDYEYTKVEVVKDPQNPSPLAAQIEQMIAPLQGATGSALLTNRGFTKQAELNVPPGVAPMLRAMLDGMKQSMERLGSPVPEEEVGAGGKWRVTQDLTMNGMELTQISIYELTDVSEDQFSVDVSVRQEAEQQQINSPMLPPGAKLTLESLDTSGSGQMLLASDSIVPRNSQMTITSKTNMNVEAGEQTQAMAMQMTMEMTFEPAVPSEPVQ